MIKKAPDELELSNILVCILYMCIGSVYTYNATIQKKIQFILKNN